MHRKTLDSALRPCCARSGAERAGGPIAPAKGWSVWICASISFKVACNQLWVKYFFHDHLPTHVLCLLFYFIFPFWLVSFNTLWRVTLCPVLSTFYPLIYLLSVMPFAAQFYSFYILSSISFLKMFLTLISVQCWKFISLCDCELWKDSLLRMYLAPFQGVHFGCLLGAVCTAWHCKTHPPPLFLH